MAYDVKRDGFKLKQDSHGINDISTISLKVALESYFSTYKAVSHHFSSIVNPNPGDDDEIRNRKYYEYYSETILHFHHFIELSLKKILESVHKLFVYEMKDIIPLYKVIKNEITEEEFEDAQKNSAGFNDTLERVIKLINENYLPGTEYGFIKTKKKVIEDLNFLRNRIIHRGMYIFPYKLMEELIGKDVLPLVMEFTKLPVLQLNKLFWKYRKVKCNIDPIDEIISEFNQQNFSIGKVAFLKELGRAAYNENAKYVNIGGSFGLSQEQIELYENMALGYLAHHDLIPKLRKLNLVPVCPVCGLKTLVLEKEYIDEENEKGEIIKIHEWVISVKCIHCSFEMINNCDNVIKNPSQFGYTNIQDWFD